VTFLCFPLDLEGRQTKREELIRKAEEHARRQVEHFNYSPTCSGQFGEVDHGICAAGSERCLCYCHDPKRTEPHEADS
jgi:hypothetical protein